MALFLSERILVIDACRQHGKVDAFFPAADGKACGTFHQRTEFPFIDTTPFAEDEDDAVFLKNFPALIKSAVIMTEVLGTFAEAVDG